MQKGMSRFSQHQENIMSEEFSFLLYVAILLHQTFIIISGASSKHQMPQYSATLTVSGQLPSAPWDICIYSLTWISLYSLHLFEMSLQLPTTTLFLSAPDHYLTTAQITSCSPVSDSCLIYWFLITSFSY